MSAKNSPTRGEVLITRDFTASCQQLFAAWSTKETLARWYAPTGCEIEFRTFDFSIGGNYHSCIRVPANGFECWCIGQYLEIETDRRIVFTMAVADEAANIADPIAKGMDPDWPQQTVVTVTFEPIATGTRLTLHQTVDESLAKKTGAHPGWLSMLDNLSELQQSVDA